MRAGDAFDSFCWSEQFRPHRYPSNGCAHWNVSSVKTFENGLNCKSLPFRCISFPTVYLYAGELFPTVIRNVAIGLASMIARIGSMIAPFVASGLSDTAHWLPPGENCPTRYSSKSSIAVHTSTLKGLLVRSEFRSQMFASRVQLPSYATIHIIPDKIEWI